MNEKLKNQVRGLVKKEYHRQVLLFNLTKLGFHEYNLYLHALRYSCN